MCLIRNLTPANSPGKFRNPEAFADTARPRDVGLQDLDIAFLDQPLEISERRLFLAAGDRRRDGGHQCGIFAVVVGPERLLDPE